MERISLLISEEDCMGCHACEIACKQEHNLGVGPKLIRVIENSPHYIPVYCHHCIEAPCLESCPVDAIFTDELGVVLIDSELCTGCRECIEACPYGAMQFDDENEVAIKCDLCIERLRNNDQPACSKACPTQCIFWGPVKNLSDNTGLKQSGGSVASV